MWLVDVGEQILKVGERGHSLSLSLSSKSSIPRMRPWRNNLSWRKTHNRCLHSVSYAVLAWQRRPSTIARRSLALAFSMLPLMPLGCVSAGIADRRRIKSRSNNTSVGFGELFKFVLISLQHRRRVAITATACLQLSLTPNVCWCRIRKQADGAFCVSFQRIMTGASLNIIKCRVTLCAQQKANVQVS